MERKSVPVYLNTMLIPGIEITIVKPMNQTVWMVDVINMMRSERELIAHIPDYKKITERHVFEDKIVLVLNN
jgi:hypothetical protein